MTRDKDDGFLDGMLVKYLAGAVIVVCVGALAWLNRDALYGKSGAEEPAINPEFVKCRDERVSQIAKLRDEGVITENQFEVFRTRAIETCAGQFPPG